MANVGTVILVALVISMVGNRGEVRAQALQPFTPKAAEQYVDDSKKASEGDPEAAFRVGQALESGRLGGVKNLEEALKFYKLAAQKGHQQAATREAELEAELGQSQNKEGTPDSVLKDNNTSQTAP